MTRSLATVLFLSAAAAAGLLLSSCNTVSGFGQDLQDASRAVQHPQ